MQRLSDNPYGWIILVDGRFAGEVRLDNISNSDRTASLAIAIYDPALLGHGYGRSAIMKTLATAFMDLDLHRVSIRVLASNLRAIRCYQACGFKIEGREREAAQVGQHREDDVIMGLLRHEWFQSQP